MSLTPASWNFSNKEETEENYDVRQIPTSIIHPSNYRRTILKNSVKPGWVEPDLNYILLLDKLDILPM